MKKLKIKVDDLANNPSIRLPICLLLDTSSSMKGSRIDKLNEGMKMFQESVCSDEVLKLSAEICIITFGNKGFSDENNEGPNAGIKNITDFGYIENHKIPDFEAGGYTPMGEAVQKAINMLQARKKEYKKNGVEYYQPWLVLMTDGQPYDFKACECCNQKYRFHSIDDAVNESTKLINDGGLVLLPIGIGNDEELNMEVLKRFSPKIPPLKLEGLKFKEFFDWLTQSMLIVSRSNPGTEVNLPPTTWAKVKI
jgi:uncharacterized protein YegL